MLKMALIIIVLVLAGFLAFVRLAPSDPEIWHVDPLTAKKPWRKRNVFILRDDGSDPSPPIYDVDAGTLAKAFDAFVKEALAHHPGAQAQLVDGPGPQVLDHHIGLGDETHRHIVASRALEVERDGALATVVGPHHRLAIAADMARLITSQRFDLGDAGAQLGQRHGRSGARDVLPQIHHAHTQERCRRQSCTQGVRGMVSGHGSLVLRMDDAMIGWTVIHENSKMLIL